MHDGLNASLVAGQRMRLLRVALLLPVVALSSSAHAVVTTTTRSTEIVGTGGTVFNVPFPFADAASLKVTKVLIATSAETLLVLNTDYTVTLPVGSVLGKVTTVAPVVSTHKLRIERSTPLTQTTSLGSQGAFYPAIHEKAFDKLTMAIQDSVGAIPELQAEIDGKADINHTHATLPTSIQKEALAGTSDTPSASNRYVTDTDPRNTNARTPTAHASSHASGQSDQLTHNSLAGLTTGDPHTQYILDLERGIADGVAPIDSGGHVPANLLPAATTSAAGLITLAVDGGTSAGTVVQGNDARLDNARAPSGAAGGQLGGTYPNPDVRGIRTTAGGGTQLTISTIADGECLKRTGSTIAGGACGTGTVDWSTVGPAIAAATGDISVNSQRITNLAPPVSSNDAVNKLWAESTIVSPSRVAVATASLTTSIGFNAQRLTNLGTPSSGNDAATKGYVDALIPLSTKTPVRVATTANTVLSGAQTIDGVSVIAGDRVLVKAQTTASQNGIYVAASGAWARASDMNNSALAVPAMVITVSEGTANADTAWMLTTNADIDLGATSLTFAQFGGGGSVNFTAVNAALATADATVGFNSQDLNAISRLRIGGAGPGRAFFGSAAADTIPTSFSDNDLVVGLPVASGAGSGALFMRYDSTNNAAFLGALSPSVAWRTLFVGVNRLALQNASGGIVALLPGTSSDDLALKSSGRFLFSSGSDAALSADTGIERIAAGVPGATNGSGTLVPFRVGAPSSGSDATTKTYVDGALAGTAWKAPVRAATVADHSLTGLAAFDGVTPVAGDRILVKAQTTASQNGIYVASAGSWGRASDLDTSAEAVTGLVVQVSEGSVNSDSGWMLTTNAPITLGSTSLVFGPALTQFSIGNPAAVGTAFAGTSNFVARSDHVHAHGNQTGGSLHANATTSTAGFASANDKLTIDALRPSVRAATTASITLSAPQTIDGVSVIAGDRVLVKNQTTGSENGIYVVAAGSWTRATDMAAAATILGVMVVVREGTAAADGVYLLTNDSTVTVGTTAQTWARYAPSSGSTVLWSKHFAADMVLPVDSGWTSASAHTATTATLEVANLVNFRAFDQTTAEGVGLELVLPDNAVTINAVVDVAAATSGFTSSNGVQLTLCCRPKYGTGSFACVDGAPFTMTDNATKQRKTQSWTLSGLSLVDEDVAICELARDTADADDTLTRDLRMLDLMVEVVP